MRQETLRMQAQTREPPHAPHVQGVNIPQNPMLHLAQIALRESTIISPAKMLRAIATMQLFST